MPDSIKNNTEGADVIYDSFMNYVRKVYASLQEQGIPKEDIANILPFGMHTTVVLKINLRAIIHLFEERTCKRAYEEFRYFMRDLRNVLHSLDSEWADIMDSYAITKCEKTGFCLEEKCCGRFPKK
jgi:thymidylate synthase (FAD)